MSREEADFWNSIKKYKQEKRNKNEADSKRILKEWEIDFIEKPNGHIIVGDWSLWTTTGKFYNHMTQQKGRGVFNFIKVIQGEKNE